MEGPVTSEGQIRKETRTIIVCGIYLRSRYIIMLWLLLNAKQ